MSSPELVSAQVAKYLDATARAAEAARNASVPQRDHLAFVDGLRGIAVLGVLLLHGTQFSHSVELQPLIPLLKFGQHGVDLFFVISGFCLSYPMLARIAAGDSPKLDLIDFFSKRLVRIFPPYLVALAAFVALSFDPGWGNLIRGHFIDGPYTAVSTLREAFLIDGGPLHNGSFWTLALELRWYALFPIALAVFLRWPLSFVPISVAAWSAYYLGLNASQDALLFPAFLMGIVAAYAATHKPVWLRLAPLVLAVSVLVLALSHFSQLNPGWELLAFGVVLLAVASTRAQRTLSWKPLVMVGLASYSIYLVHQPFVLALEIVGRAPYFVAIPFGLAVGFAFWRLVERPMLRPGFRRPAVNALRRALSAAVDRLRALELLTLADGYRDSMRPGRPLTCSPKSDSTACSIR